MKFRILEKISDSGSNNRTRKFVIERKTFWGWREIQLEEKPLVNSIHYATYAIAEQNLLEKYTGHGGCIRYGNVYVYTPYSYSY